MSLHRNIKFLSVEEERKFENNAKVHNSRNGETESVKFLNIFSEKSANLLNEVINWRIGSCETKARVWGTPDEKDLKGGGLFVKCKAEIVITSIGEVALKFKETMREDIKKYLRVAAGVDEQNKAIKDKLANELKKFWNAYSKSINMQGGTFKIKFMDQNGSVEKEFEYCETDYRVLYEVLKGRNIDKLKMKYSQSKWDEMIGKKLEDQFILTAIETIQNEIAKIAATRDNDIKAAEEAYRSESNALWEKNKKNKERIENEATDKIKNLQNQINEMMKMGNMMAAGFTF